MTDTRVTVSNFDSADLLVIYMEPVYSDLIYVAKYTNASDTYTFVQRVSNNGSSFSFAKIYDVNCIDKSIVFSTDNSYVLCQALNSTGLTIVAINAKTGAVVFSEVSILTEQYQSFNESSTILPDLSNPTKYYLVSNDINGNAIICYSDMDPGTQGY